jgi:hypothetical protein
MAVRCIPAVEVIELSWRGGLGVKFSGGLDLDKG